MQVEEKIVENILLNEVIMRYLVTKVNGEALAVCMYEEHAEEVKNTLQKVVPEALEVLEIDVEDIHEYM